MLVKGRSAPVGVQPVCPCKHAANLSMSTYNQAGLLPLTACFILCRSQQCQIGAWVQVAKAEGLYGFYRGFGAVLSGVVPATALYFAGYETGKRWVPASYGIMGDMLVGCYTQAIAGIVFTPVDIIKERMQVRLQPDATSHAVFAHKQATALMQDLHGPRHQL